MNSKAFDRDISVNDALHIKVHILSLCIFFSMSG